MQEVVLVKFKGIAVDWILEGIEPCREIYLNFRIIANIFLYILQHII